MNVCVHKGAMYAIHICVVQDFLNGLLRWDIHVGIFSF